MKQVKISFRNGLAFEGGVAEILSDLTGEFEFINSDDPDFIVFGPYGNNVPPKGKYTRVGYYCEAIAPDLEICEWAFGVPREEEIKNARYKRIQWHGLNPQVLLKNINAEEVYKQKNRFCNFLYSNPISYREEFFRQLSKYKKVDAPGKSMNNMPPIDQQYKGNTWETKRQFLTPYKFTIAFESYSYPGYQTEKLYDAMQMNSVPIYCGDPLVNEIFNPESFVNAADYLAVRNAPLKNLLEKYGQYTFKDFRPGTFTGLNYRVRRKLKTIAKRQKMRLQVNKLDFTPLIDRIIELDKNPDLYMTMLKEPWLNDNKVPEDASVANRWREIFSTVKTDG